MANGDEYEKIINQAESAREDFLKDIDLKNSTAEILEGGKIIIFPATKNNLSPKEARKQLAKKLTKQKEIRLYDGKR